MSNGVWCYLWGKGALVNHTLALILIAGSTYDFLCGGNNLIWLSTEGIYTDTDFLNWLQVIRLHLWKQGSWQSWVSGRLHFSGSVAITTALCISPGSSISKDFGDISKCAISSPCPHSNTEFHPLVYGLEVACKSILTVLRSVLPTHKGMFQVFNISPISQYIFCWTITWAPSF